MPLLEAIELDHCALTSIISQNPKYLQAHKCRPSLLNHRFLLATMKGFTSVATFAAIAAVTGFGTFTFAFECTNDDTEVVAEIGNAIASSCPSLTGTAGEIITSGSINLLTTADLDELAPCQKANCMSVLEDAESAAPDCTVDGVSGAVLYGSVYNLCFAFAMGEVTVSDAQDILGPIASSTSSTSEPTDDGNPNESERTTAPSATTKKTSSGKDDSDSTTTTAGNKPTSAPVPTTTAPAAASSVASTPPGATTPTTTPSATSGTSGTKLASCVVLAAGAFVTSMMF